MTSGRRDAGDPADRYEISAAYEVPPLEGPRSKPASTGIPWRPLLVAVVGLMALVGGLTHFLSYRDTAAPTPASAPTVAQPGKFVFVVQGVERTNKISDPVAGTSMLITDEWVVVRLSATNTTDAPARCEPMGSVKIAGDPATSFTDYLSDPYAAKRLGFATGEVAAGVTLQTAIVYRVPAGAVLISGWVQCMPDEPGSEIRLAE
jgi:hypothetical protein